MSPPRWASGLLGLALAFRLLLLWTASAEPGRFFHEPDSSGYERLALNLLGHGRFSLDDGPPFKPDHTRTPVYPALLAALYAVTGRQPAAAALLNVLAGVATVALLIVAGGRLVGPAPALLAGGILAVDPASAGYSALLLTEPLFTLLLSLALLAFLAALRTGEVGAAGRAGVWCGVASLARPIGLYLPLLLGGTLAVVRWRTGWRRALGGALLLLLATAFLTAPWALRNLLTGGGFELSSIGAINLYYQRAAAVVADAEGIPREVARRRLAARLEAVVAAERLSEAVARRLMTAWAVEIIRSDPWRYARLHLEGIGRMLGPAPGPLFQLLGWLGPDGRLLPHRRASWRVAAVVEGLFLGGLYLAAVAGVWRAARGGRVLGILPAVLVIGYAVLVGGPEMYPRFRVPLMPWLAWLAALGLAPWPRGEAVYHKGTHECGRPG